MTIMTIEEVLKAVGAEGCRWEADSNEDYPTYTVTVPRALIANVERRLDRLTLDLYVRLMQERPVLVHAQLGDFVRVYSPRKYTDADSPVGLVTAVRGHGETTSYGCSYIQTSLGNPFISHVYSFQLTAEDYGGYHPGFLKVITPEELTAALKERVEKGYKKAVEEADRMKTATLYDLDDFVKALGKGTALQVSRLILPDVPHGVQSNVPSR